MSFLSRYDIIYLSKKAEELGFVRDTLEKVVNVNAKMYFLESQNVQLLEFNVQKNLILIIHLCF